MTTEKKKNKAFHPISEYPNFLCLPFHPANNALLRQGITQHFSPEFVTAYEALIHTQITLRHTRHLKEQSHRQMMMFMHRNSTKYYNHMIVMKKVAHLTLPKNESAHLHISTGLHKMGTEVIMSASPKIQA